MLIMNLNLIFRNKRWIILDLYVRVSTLNFFQSFGLFRTNKSYNLSICSDSPFIFDFEPSMMIKIRKRGGSWVYLWKIGDTNQKKEEKRRWSSFFVSEVYFDRNFENKSKFLCLLTLRLCDFTGSFFDSLSSHFFVSVITPFRLLGDSALELQGFAFDDEDSIWISENCETNPLFFELILDMIVELHFLMMKLVWFCCELMWIDMNLRIFVAVIDSVVVVWVCYGGFLILLWWFEFVTVVTWEREKFC
jgi:hypothetical protein